MSSTSTLSDQIQPLQDDDAIKMYLKWFNGTKGFGFVMPEDESFDAFLHVTTLQEAGLHALGEGAILMCSLFDGPKGKQVKVVKEVLDTGKVNLMPEDVAEDGSFKMGGIVKWYKADKGFGFIIPDDGMKDIFIHKTLLDKLDLEELTAGQRVKVTLKVVDKGREALDLEVIR